MCLELFNGIALTTSTQMHALDEVLSTQQHLPAGGGRRRV